MSVIQFKVGDKVRVLDVGQTRNDLWFEEGQVEVVDTVEEDRVWVKLPHHKIEGYRSDYSWEFGNAASRLELMATAPTKGNATSRPEAPCKTCKRPNDVGVAVCWMCGNSPF